MDELKPVVLLVDDQRMVGEAVRRMLAAEPDITFHFCIDPAVALERAIELRPTIILQDLVMPGVDGFMLLASYRSTPSIRDVPVVVLSSNEVCPIPRSIPPWANKAQIAKAPTTAPTTWAVMYAGTSRHGNRFVVASANVTAGFMWQPETFPIE